MPFTVTETRVCNDCKQELPIGHFRRREKGGTERLPDCRDCHTRNEKRNRAIRRRRRLRAGLQSITTAATDEEMRRLVKALLIRAGGADRLAEQMCDLVERIEKQSRRVSAKWHWEVHLALFMIMKASEG